MTDKEQSKKAKEFAEFWKDKGYEKGQSQQFWTSLLNNVFDIQEPEKFIEFEDQVHIDKNTGFIDGYIPTTKVLIEQKSIDKDEIDQGQIQEEFIPASNEPSGCLQTFGDCREGQQPRCSATGLLTSDSSSDLNEEEKMETKELEA